MSYPQPDADQYAVKGYQYFRLNTPLSSPGDLYQSAQSGHALAIGPDSDIANVNVAYFDDQVPTFLQQTTISPFRAFEGRVDARNDARYTPSGRPAKILFWPADLYDPSYVPLKPFATGVQFDPTQDAITFITPQLDVIEYFKPQPSLTAGRRDKDYIFADILAAARWTYLVLPYYGRRYFHLRMGGLFGTSLPLTFGIYGLLYFNSFNSIETQLLAPVATPISVSQIYTAQANGTYDAIVLSFLNTFGATRYNAVIRITVSDTVGG